MKIHVQCAGCGAKFQAPEKLAGKRVKCPKCSAVIAVGERSRRPSGQATSAEEKTPLIPVACLCGKKLRVKAELAGKRVKCPACGQVLTVPATGPAAAQTAGELDLGQLAGVEEAAATTLGGPLSQAKKKERPASTRLIIGLSVGGAAVLVLLMVLVLWPSGEDKELAKKDGASSKSPTEAAETPAATGPDESAAGTDEELIDSQVLTQAATELFAQSVARAKETGQAVPPGDVVTELKKIHPAVLRITKDRESRLAAGQFDDQATSDRLQAVINQWSGADSYLKGSHPPGLKYLVQQFQGGKLHGAHLEVAQRLLDAEFVAYSQALGGSARPLSQEEPRAGASGPRTYPSFPDALTQPPAWIGSDTPLDVAKFLEVPRPEENAALLYLDALFEFSSDVAMCFYEQGQEPDGEILRRIETANGRYKEYSRLEEAWRKNPASVDNATVDEWLKGYETGFQKLAVAQERPAGAFETGVSPSSLLPHTQARQVARIVKWRTRRDLARADFERPILGVETVLRLSRDLRPRGADICQMVGVAMDNICCEEIVPVILTTEGVTAQHCDRLLAALVRHESEARDPFLEATRFQYIMDRTVLHDLQHRVGMFDPQYMKDGLGVRSAVDSPFACLSVLKDLGGYGDRLAREKYGEAIPRTREDAVKHPLARGWSVDGKLLSDDQYAKEVDAVNRVYKSLLDLADRTNLERDRVCAAGTMANPLRDTTLAIYLEPPPQQPLLRAFLRAEAILRGTICLVSLRRWQLEKNVPPPDLAAVIRASGMKEVPTDPYSGQPMRMTMVNGELVIYSVAMDGKDDRGRVDVWKSSQRGKLGDLLFRLNASQ